MKNSTRLFLSRFIPKKEILLEKMKITYYLLLAFTTILFPLGLIILPSGIDLLEHVTENASVMIVMIIGFLGILTLFLSVTLELNASPLKKSFKMFMRLLSIILLISTVVVYIPLFPEIIYFEKSIGFSNFGPVYSHEYNFNGILLVILVGLSILSTVAYWIIKFVSSRKN